MHRRAVALVSILFGAALALALAPNDATAAPERGRCGTLERIPAAADKPRPAVSFAVAGPGAKLTRDSIGTGYQVRTSDNFAVKWTGAPVTEADATRILAALEESWTFFLDELGHSLPTGGATYRMNVYVGDATDTPDIDFEGGYTDLDTEGYPYIVLHEDLLDPSYEETLLRHIVVHEFYHDVQYSIDAYWDEPAWWYWEATAEWATQVLYSDEVDAFLYIGAYALAPEVPLFYFGDVLDDELLGSYQYGASLFTLFISEELADRTVIRESWETAASEDDPIVVLDELLGGGIDDAFAAHAAHNALWDYAVGDHVIAGVETFEEWYPGTSPITDRVDANGTDGLTGARVETLPGAYGYNVIEITRPVDGVLRVAVEADAAGSSGTPARATASLVRGTTTGIEYLPVGTAAGDDPVEVAMEANEPVAYLVVAVAADTRSNSEKFGYRFSVGSDDAPPIDPPDDDDDGGCGCTVGASPRAPATPLLLLLGLLAVRLRFRLRAR